MSDSRIICLIDRVFIMRGEFYGYYILTFPGCKPTQVSLEPLRTIEAMIEALGQLNCVCENTLDAFEPDWTTYNAFILIRLGKSCYKSDNPTLGITPEGLSILKLAQKHSIEVQEPKAPNKHCPHLISGTTRYVCGIDPPDEGYFPPCECQSDYSKKCPKNIAPQPNNTNLPAGEPPNDP